MPEGRRAEARAHGTSHDEPPIGLYSYGEFPVDGVPEVVVVLTLFWRMPPAPGAAGTPPVTQRAVRRGKYIDDRGQYFLFEVRTDTGERHDVAQQHADLVRELRSLVAKWEADVDAESKERTTPAR